MNPFGYHLTDVALHLLVIALIVVLVAHLTRGDLTTATVAAVIFALHPVLAESVPAPDHRHDILAAVFLLISLILFVTAYHRKNGRRWLLALSVGSYLLALGARDLSIYLPGLIFSYAAKNLAGMSRPRRVVRSLGGDAASPSPSICGSQFLETFRADPQSPRRQR